MARAKTLIEQPFSYTAPTAETVLLVGDFTHWEKDPIRLQRQAGGVWRTKVPLPPGKHHYRFIVDGVWRDDPEAATRVANPFGSEDAVRDVGRPSL